MSRQLITSDEARMVPQQPTTPCSDCPFARTAMKGWLGGADVDDWVQAAQGEEEMACHAITIQSPLDNGDVKPVQCAGAAIYRANICKLLQDPKAFQLEANEDLVFASPVEFVEHHRIKSA